MATQSQDVVKTLVIDNFRGMMTNYYFGDINSGRSWIQVVSGQNPFLKPGQLTWSEQPTLIDSAGSVITDLIMCGKERVESGISYVYAVGHTGRVYKIQVNNPSTYNPDYDNPVLLTTLTAQSPTFTRGGFIDFYGATERMYIGHDMGVTQLNFNGTGETFVGSTGSWVQTVPRPIRQFAGNLVVGNGTNIAIIDSTLTVTSYTKLSPGFPAGTQTRSIVLSPDGQYVEMAVNRLALEDITSTAQPTSANSVLDSFIYRWNGQDLAASSITSLPSISVDATVLFQDKQFSVGNDAFGKGIFEGPNKIFNMPEVSEISPNAFTTTGGALIFTVPLYFNGFLECDTFFFGNFDFEVGVPLGFWDIMFQNATTPQTDVLRVPMMLPISNTGLGASNNNYTGNIFGTPKIYFSTLETSSGTTKYRLYKWKFLDSLQLASTTALSNALYQTQTKLFPKKVVPLEVRIYGEPWVSGNSFQIDLTGSLSSTTITGGTKVFTAGTNLTVGNDMAQYNPQIAPTYALGVSITNLGTVNHTINKIEIDYKEAGK